MLNRLASVDHYYTVQKNLASLRPGSKPAALSSVTVITNRDIGEIIQAMERLDGEPKREIIARRLFYKSGFKNCYIARTETNQIAFMQWLIFPSENDVIKRHFEGRFYPLRQGQVVIENAFTFPNFRRLGFMTFGIGQLLGIAKEAGYKSAIACVRKDRIASLNVFTKMGFKISKMVKEHKLIGITITERTL